MTKCYYADDVHSYCDGPVDFMLDPKRYELYCQYNECECETESHMEAYAYLCDQHAQDRADDI